jgi:RHS repeat-associated protein
LTRIGAAVFVRSLLVRRVRMLLLPFAVLVGVGLLVASSATANPSNQTLPTVSGSSGMPFRSGETLTASTSASDWSYSGSVAFAYQWQDCSSYSSLVKGNSPAGYWRLGESSGASKALDSSGNAADGNYGGSVALGQAGALAGDPDTAAGFDGSTASVEVPDASALDPTSGFTLEAWVKTTASSGTMIAKPFAVSGSQSYSLGLSGGKAVATVVTTSATYTATSSAAVNDGSWHLLDATWTANSLKIYVDAGTAVAATTAGSLQYSALPLEIGRFDSTAGQYFNGTLDEVAVYDSALTSFSTAKTVAIDPVNSSSCSPISGATAQTYQPTDADVGKKVSVKVTATDANGPTSVYSDSETVLQGSAPQATAPANTTPPDISGTPAAGETLSASNGVWTGSAPLSFNYQWERCSGTCANIAGATSSTYAVQTADQGSALLVSVTAANAAGSASATSAQTATVPTGPTAPVNSVLPSVSGTAEANQTLTATGGTWTGATPIALAFQWQLSTNGGSSWSAIAGATSKTFVVPTTDVGDEVRVEVTATNGVGSTPADSTATAAIVSGTGPSNTQIPSLAGSFTVGETLTANPGSWNGSTPLTYTYQWQDCSSYRSAVLANSPAGFWQLGDATGAASAADVSGNGLAATYGGNVSYGQSGALAGDPDTAVGFDGLSTYLEAPDATALDPSGGVSVEAWVKTSATTGVLVDKPFVAGQKKSYGLELSSGKAEGEVYVGTTAFTAVGTSAVNDGKWHQVVMAFDGASLRLYVDGALQTTTTAAGSLQYAALPLEIGRFDGSAGQYFQGSLDDVAVYPAALTGSQVSGDYHAGTDASGAAPCTNISGANDATYTLTSGDLGKKILVQATASNPDGTSAPISSASTLVAGSAPVDLSAPKVTGTAAIGDALTADSGSWSGASPISYAYQWQRCNSYSAAVLADQPVGYWRLNEQSGTTANDSSGNSLAGTYTSIGAGLGADGALSGCDPSNSAASFNGSSSYVSVPNASQLDIGGPSTVEAWFKGPGSAPSANEYLVNRGSPYDYIVYIDTGGHVAFQADTSAGALIFNFSGSTVVTGGGWYHLAATWDGSTARIFINGALDASKTASGTPNTGAGGLYVGRADSAASNYVNGTVDEVAVYNKALTPTQVATHYQAALGAFIPVAGATNSSYSPAAADANTQLRVQVTASNTVGSASALSTAMLVTSNGPTNDVVPTVTGSAQVGETLSASNGVWSSSSSINYAYQWESAASYEQSVLADSPLNYWRLDDPAGSTTAFDLGSAHDNGAYSTGGGSGLQLGAQGALAGDPDTAVNFQPGEGYVPVADSLGSTFTIEGWFDTTATSGTQVNPILAYSHFNNCAGGGSGDCAYPQVMVNDASGKLQGHACDTANSCVSITSSTAVNDGKWHLFELERNGSSWTLYLDNAKVGSSASGAGGNLSDGYNNINLGAAYGDDIGYSGLLDEPAIYGTDLSCAGTSTCTGGSIYNHYTAATTAPKFSAISGATNPTYTVQSSDLSANLRAEITAQNASGSTPADSLGTGSVTGSGGPVNTALPKLSGQASVGQTLVSDQGSWTGQTPINDSYQWQRITGSYANAVLGDGPAGYWRLDEPAGNTVNDASGNGHTGAYSGNVTHGESSALSGDSDSSISLADTSAYATVPDAASLDTPQFTIEGWVRGLTTGAYQKIIGKGPDASEQWGLYIAPTSGYANVQAEIGGAQVTLTGTGSSSDRVGDNTWHYVAATWDGTTLTLYWSDPLNYPNAPIRSVTLVPGSGKTLKTNTEQISIGKEVSSTTSQYPFTAGMHQLDDLAEYAKPLTASQVSAHYTAGRTAPTITPISGATSSSYTLNSADQGASVRSQVTATNVNGSTSAYSLQTVPLGANPPTLALPNDGDTSHTPEPVLSVQPITGVGSVSYEFQVAADKGFTSIVADSGWIPSTTTWTVPTTANLADGHTYYWQAKALYGGLPTSWSAVRSFHVAIKRYGTRGYWPIWSGDGVSVNEANGNLIAAAPAASFPTEIASLGISLAYNTQDTTSNGLGAGWTLSAGDSGATPPSKLIDHAVLHQFDAAEIVWPDGGSDYYDHIGQSNTYRAHAGSGDQLTKNVDGTWTLLSSDGYVYSFGKANTTSGVAVLSAAEAADTAVGKSALTFTYNASGQLASIYDSADSTRKVTLNWACTGYLLCVTGPDGIQWTYKGVSGATGALATVNDGTRNIVQFAYNGNGLLSKIQNANDLDPSHASSGYNGSHAVTIGYDADKRVTSVTNGPVTGQTPSSSTVSFAYHLAGPYPTDPTRADHADAPTGTVRQAAGYTTLTDPDGHQGSVYFDSADRPIETVDPLGRIGEAGWNSHDEQTWTEDPNGNPTDSIWDTVNDVLKQTQAPDSGSGRPTSNYRYDETAAGTTATAGPALQGLQGRYFPNVNLAGRATTTRTDANVDSDWGGNGPDAGVGATNYSARYSGDIIVPSDGDYTFSTYADSGTILVVDNLQAINTWTTNTKLSTQSSQPIHLTAGEHTIALDYFEGATAASHLHLLWSCATCSTPFSTQLVPASAFAPGWDNQTSVIDALGNVSFTHYANPAKGNPDYSLDQPGDGSQLITSFTYDAYGRTIEKVMPKGNLGRAISADGTLSGAIDSTYATTYSYYAPGATAIPPASCGGSSADQGGQLQSETQHGIAATSYVYDTIGDILSKTNAKGITCLTYDAAHRLTSSIAPGDAQKTTFTYDPAGNTLTQSDASGTLSNHYDEAGRLTETTDSYGAQAALSYDAAGNVLTRTAAVGPLASSPHYIAQYTYDGDGEVTSEIDPAGRSYNFFYDDRGDLQATQYPNGTFSWNAISADGWLMALYNRHGDLGGSPPASAPSDASPIADFNYQYDQAGQRTQEVLSASGQSDQTTGYSYDGMGRLTQASLPDSTCRSYAYDADSNRTQIQESPSGCSGTFSTAASYTYNSSVTPGVDQLTSVAAQNGTATYTYTSDGEVKSYGSSTITWDGWGRISGGTFNGDSVTYHYDPSGALKSRTSTNGDETRYLLGDLFETDGSGHVTVAYVDGPGGDLAEYAGPPTATSSISYLYYNGHGDLAAEADSAGSRTTLHTYDPFGAPLDAPPADSTSHLYTGKWNKQYDSGSRLILMGARPYDPTLGRFLSVDPVDGGSLNNYDYAGQDPVNNYDLDGTKVRKPKKHAIPRPRAEPVSRIGLGGLALLLAGVSESVGPLKESSGATYTVRLQAQGGSVEKSVVISQSQPVTVQQGTAALTALKAQLAPQQAAVRAPLFAQAQRFIINAGNAGGVGPPGRTFVLPGSKGIRVDVEVLRGINFVNPFAD